MSEPEAKPLRKRRLIAGCAITAVVLVSLLFASPWLYGIWGRIDAKLVYPDDLPSVQQRRIQAFKSEMKRYYGADLATVSVQYRKYLESDCMDNEFAMREYWGSYSVRGADSAMYFTVDTGDLNLSSRGWYTEYKDEHILHTSLGGPARLASLMRAADRDYPAISHFGYWLYPQEAEFAKTATDFETGADIDCDNPLHRRKPTYAVNRYGRFRVADIVLVGNYNVGLASDDASGVYRFGKRDKAPQRVGDDRAAHVFVNAVVHKGCSVDDPDEYGTASAYEADGEEYTTFQWR